MARDEKDIDLAQALATLTRILGPVVVLEPQAGSTATDDGTCAAA